MAINQNQYIHAMDEDSITGKPMPKVGSKINGSDVMLPIDVQGHYQSTIQTHNAVSILASSGSNGGWIDCAGFDTIAITVMNDAVTQSYIDIQWSHDGVNQQGLDSSVADSQQYKAMSVPTKGRYARIRIGNGDTVAHTMSAWAYLKA